MKKEQGYTLIEITVATIVLVILGASGLYGWQSYQAHQRLWQTAWQVRDYLELLRNDANWHNRDRKVWVKQESGRWCLLASADAQATCGGNNPLALRPLWPEVALVDITPSLGFYGLRNTAWAGHITLRSEAGEWQIIVSNWGRIRVCQRTNSGACS